MLIGSLTDIEEFSRLEQSRRDNALQAMLDEFRVNPVIDKEVRGNKVIMQELAKAVNRTIDPAADPEVAVKRLRSKR
ncbi:MAG TPA: hypothetical protein VLU25_11805 [Acidobacteriota bacterium]|nr:hypothetical protein [Acidobacteriota bacterium]